MNTRLVHQELHFTAGETLREIVIGMADGLTVPCALAAGMAGAGATTTGRGGYVVARLFG